VENLEFRRYPSDAGISAFISWELAGSEAMSAAATYQQQARGKRQPSPA
jgi:hypothetical protein